MSDKLSHSLINTNNIGSAMKNFSRCAQQLSWIKETIFLLSRGDYERELSYFLSRFGATTLEDLSPSKYEEIIEELQEALSDCDYGR